jgi:FkbM family methyltransferase
MKAMIRNSLARADRTIIRLPQPLIMSCDRQLAVSLKMAVAEALDGADVSFLQVGAFDGMTNDDLFPLVRKHHYRGVALEPQDFAFKKLQAAYAAEPQVLPMHAALDWTCGQRSMYSVRDSQNAADRSPQYASFDRNVVLKHEGIQASDITESLVECITIDEVRRRSGISQFDLLQIDAEGYDFEIIKMALQAGLSPRVVRYENAHLTTSDRRACVQMLLDHGYRIAYAYQDVIACK